MGTNIAVNNMNVLSIFLIINNITIKLLILITWFWNMRCKRKWISNYTCTPIKNITATAQRSAGPAGPAASIDFETKTW